MSESSNTEKCDRDLPSVRDRIITKWHVNNLAIKPYKITNAITDASKTFWMSTEYVKFDVNAIVMYVGSNVVSKPFEISCYPGAAFEVEMYKNNNFIYLKIFRFVKDVKLRPDAGHFLRFCLEICGSPYPGKYADMIFNKNNITVPFPISNHFQDCRFDEKTVIKCGVWMYEMANLDTRVTFISQNESLLRRLDASVDLPENAYSALAFIMGCGNLNCMFSGRQDGEFAKTKILLLTRTLRFSTILAERLRCFERNTPFENAIKIDIILGYIYSGDIREIHISECVKLYLTAFKYSMHFLKQETSFFLSEKLSDPDIILDVILSAIMVDDWMLADIGIKCLFRFKDIVVASKRWKELELHEATVIEILARKKENFPSYLKT